jgi:PKD domain
MSVRLLTRLAVMVAGVALLSLGFASSAVAAVPANDDFASATVVTSFPFSDVVDITDATFTSDDLVSPCGISHTVWYTFTAPANETIDADPAGSDFSDSSLVAYEVNGGLTSLGCAFFGNSLFFDVSAGKTYYVQAGNLFTAGGNLHLSLSVVVPPPNDNFADATVIDPTALPYSDTLDTTAASSEANEPVTPCDSLSLDRTAWYAFTPTVSESITATSAYPFNTVVAAYTGTSLSDLNEVACHSNFATFHVDAGTTYYIQTGVEQGVVRTGTPIQFSLVVTPPPSVGFGFNPLEPNIFDTVQFFDFSNDPGGLGFSSETWTFGDGTSGSGCCVSHQYAKDGDYTVTLTVQTPDGRSGSASQVVSVRTHDVAVKKFVVPTAASSGQARPITVGISNTRYSETVEVDVLKSVPNQQQQLVGSITKSVPVLPAGRTASFDYSYTFTKEDAAAGKVTFFAVATIINHRDALPADNEAIATTRVR